MHGYGLGQYADVRRMLVIIACTRVGIKLKLEAKAQQTLIGSPRTHPQSSQRMCMYLRQYDSLLPASSIYHSANSLLLVPSQGSPTVQPFLPELEPRRQNWLILLARRNPHPLSEEQLCQCDPACISFVTDSLFER